MTGSAKPTGQKHTVSGQAGLPPGPGEQALILRQDALPEPETLVLKTKAPNIKQSGAWAVPRRITAKTTSGFITIDFTQATCAHREVAVEAVTRSGPGVRLYQDQATPPQTVTPGAGPAGAARLRPGHLQARLAAMTSSIDSNPEDEYADDEYADHDAEDRDQPSTPADIPDDEPEEDVLEQRQEVPYAEDDQ
jgi:hypothetical protein